jgi:hypothetical protein
MMMQTGLLDWQIRFKQLGNGGDPLIKLEKVVDWKRRLRSMTVRFLRPFWMKTTVVGMFGRTRPMARRKSSVS